MDGEPAISICPNTISFCPSVTARQVLTYRQPPSAGDANEENIATVNTAHNNTARTTTHMVGEQK